MTQSDKPQASQVGRITPNTVDVARCRGKWWNILLTAVIVPRSDHIKRTGGKPFRPSDAWMFSHYSNICAIRCFNLMEVCSSRNMKQNLLLFWKSVLSQVLSVRIAVRDETDGFKENVPNCTSVFGLMIEGFNQLAWKRKKQRSFGFKNWFIYYCEKIRPVFQCCVRNLNI